MAMIFHEQPTAAWKPFDFKLLEAYQILQDELCPKCGHPVWLCRSQSNTVEFRVRTDVCAGERALKEYEYGKMTQSERKSVTKKDRAEWGKFHYVYPVVPEVMKDAELPTRAEYYNELAKNRA